MGASGNKTTLTTPSDTQIVMTRVFDAPRDLVFEAHTSCEHLSKWWGPRRYEVSECDVDFREGGKWRMVHKGPEGEVPAFYGEYREIVRPARFTWTFQWEGAEGGGPETYVFEEQEGKTTLTTTSTFDSKESRDALLETGMEEGAAESWERLDEYLETLKAR